MTDTWDWVDEYEHKQIQRKRFYVFCLMVSLPTMLITIPSMLSPSTDDPISPSAPRLESDSDPIEHTKQTHHGSPSTDQTAKSKQLFPPSLTQVGALIETKPKTPKQLNAISTPEFHAPKTVRQSKIIRERIQKRISEIGIDRLEKFDDGKWTRLKQGPVFTKRYDYLELSVDALNDIDREIDEIGMQVDVREFLDGVADASATELIQAVVDFLEKRPDYPTNLIDQRLRGFPQEAWLELATDSLLKATRNDPAFAEAWMPIASSWRTIDNESEARYCIRRARDALGRMTAPERVIQSSIDLCQHNAFDQKLAPLVIQNASSICPNVGDPWMRSTLYAELAGLAKYCKRSQVAHNLLKQSLAAIESDSNTTRRKLEMIQRIRAATWTETPETILDLCRAIERLPYSEPLLTAKAYALAAKASAREKDRTFFLSSMLRAESALAPFHLTSYPNYLYAVHLAEANLARQRWEAAVTIANNIPDPAVRASILFRAIALAPHEVHSPRLVELFEKFSDQRWAMPALARYTTHRLQNGESITDVLTWSNRFPSATQRAAVYAGIVRRPVNVSTPENSSPFHFRIEPKLEDVQTLLEYAEQLAAELTEPLDVAFAEIQIGRAWHRLGKRMRYHSAIERCRQSLFRIWNELCMDRPPVHESINGGFVYTNDRRLFEERKTIQSILVCLRHLSSVQVELRDKNGASETFLDLANAAGFHANTAISNNLNFIHLKAMANRLESQDVSPDSIPFLKHRGYRYTHALLAALSADNTKLRQSVVGLVTPDDGKLNSPQEYAQLARAYGELAILCAKSGDVNGYRAARRSAQSLIGNGKTSNAMRLVLAVADAIAGEFQLAETNIVDGAVPWFGDADRPRAQLAIALAEDGQWKKATSIAGKIEQHHRHLRGDAWEAIARSRLRDDALLRQELIPWIVSLDSSMDQIGALCGIACAVTEIADEPKLLTLSNESEG